MDVYEPIDVLKPVADRLWIADGPVERMSFGLMSFPFPTRMVLARLADGGLLVWSPIKLVPELRAAVEQIGPVRHIVSPNRIHYAQIADWKRAFPDAVTWASPGVRERAASQRISVAFERDLADAPDAAWAADFDQLIFRGSNALSEVVFFHRATRTLVLADLIENFEREKVERIYRPLLHLGGVVDPDGKAPLDLRLTFRAPRDAARACLERMLDWSPERIVIAHGKWYERAGVDELKRAFRWLH